MSSILSIKVRGGAALLCASALVACFAASAMAAEPPRQAAPLSGEPIRLALIEALSGPFANAGESVARNIQFALDRINARGGVRLDGRARPLELVRFDSKGQTEEALALLRAAADRGINLVLQGNGSAVAAALVDAVERHNAREPAQRMLFLNYSAIDPALTNEKCSYWHFRFDAHTDMRMAALADALAADRSVRRVYLINQDYSFGRQFAQSARAAIAARRPDIEFVGDELHAPGRVKDFAPYAVKIQAARADAVVTGNWGNDLTLLVRAAREAGLDASFYTFYANSLGAPGAIGEAGVGRVRAVAEWHPNAQLAAADPIYRAFRERVKDPREDYFNMRHVVMAEMLAAAIEAAGSTEATAVAAALEGRAHHGAPYEARMRREDHQILTPLYVSVMQRAEPPALPYALEGSAYAFRTERRVPLEASAQPTSCRMARPQP